MKRLLLFSIAAGFAVVSAFAGGLVTNTNQSASWVRNPARDASRGIEAVYYNPAGIMALNNGLHFSLSNQYITQKKEVENFYPYLNQSLYKGSVKAPLFPGFYAAYKMDKVAFSFGFNPIGGGGGATFDKGLPSFEMSPSDLVPALAARGVTAYKLDAYFEGTSVFFGYQGGITFKVNDMISLYGGLRYVTAKNTYMGHLQDVQINLGGTTWLRADTYFNGLASQLGGIMAIPGNMQPIVDGGGGGFTLAQVEGAGFIDAATHTSVVAALGAIGVDATTAEAMNINQIRGAITLATPTLAANQGVAAAKAHLLRDQEADVEQTGSGFCPIIGVNLTLSEKLNIGFKYEFITEMELQNKTAKDFTTYWAGPTADSVTMFPDGEKTKSDMPSMISLGVDYKFNDKVSLSLGGHLYNDKKANYGKNVDYDLNPVTPSLALTNEDVIDRNFYEFAAGLEYQFNEKLLLSGGYLMARTGVNELYQSDLSYSNNSNTYGAGCEYALNDMMKLNFGVAFTVYQDAQKLVPHVLGGTQYLSKETYFKNTMIIALGLNISLSK
jgi:long-chain fatty acid transport protein